MTNTQTQQEKLIDLSQIAVFLLFAIMFSLTQIIPSPDKLVNASSKNFIGPVNICTVRNIPLEFTIESDSKIDTNISINELYSKVMVPRDLLLSMQAGKIRKSPFLFDEDSAPFKEIELLKKNNPSLIINKDETSITVEEIEESTETVQETYEDTYYDNSYYEETYYEPEPVFETEPAPVVINPCENYSNELLQDLTPEDNQAVRIIALAIDYESNGTIEDDYGIASVIVNRIHHDAFPGTDALAVLTQPGQYPWADSDSSIANLCGSEESLKVAYDVYVNGNNIFPENVVFQAQFPQGNGTYQIIGVHYYCYL